MQLHPGFIPLPSMLVPICTYHSLQSIERLCNSDILYKLAVHTLYRRGKKGNLPTRISPVTIPSLSPHAPYLNCLASRPSPSFRSSASSVTVTFRPIAVPHIPCHLLLSSTVGTAIPCRLLRLPTPLAVIRRSSTHRNFVTKPGTPANAAGSPELPQSPQESPERQQAPQDRWNTPPIHQTPSPAIPFTFRHPSPSPATHPPIGTLQQSPELPQSPQESPERPQTPQDCRNAPPSHQTLPTTHQSLG